LSGWGVWVGVGGCGWGVGVQGRSATEAMGLAALLVQVGGMQLQACTLTTHVHTHMIE
jgi:hypothetical protein